RTADTVHSLRRKRSWALTGTPVENRASDLVSLLEFVGNDRMTTLDERPEALRASVSKVLLRRTKEMVMSEMPPKIIRDSYIDLHAGQREKYEAAEKEGIVRLNEMGEAVTVEHVFELIRHLKQLCNYDPATGESAKADQLAAHIEEIAQSGKKAILFSQYVTTIEFLADRLKDFNPLVYHGGVAHRDRDPILASFKDDADRPVILMSYGTGAVGLNLQFSNYVFLYDRWWNPAIEDQAINRAHRIGQKSTVMVFRFISPATIEEKIAAVLERKRQLFAYLIDEQNDGRPPGSEDGSTSLTREEVFGLFDLKIGSRPVAV
ncbi:MAG: DEAD/DEAH box helicase, partial [Planctomycetia bacterium]